MLRELAMRPNDGTLDLAVLEQPREYGPLVRVRNVAVELRIQQASLGVVVEVDLPRPHVYGREDAVPSGILAQHVAERVPLWLVLNELEVVHHANPTRSPA